MKSFIVLALLVAAAVAAPANPADAEAQVLVYNSNNIGVDGYNYEYGTSNGINAQEEAVLKKVAGEKEEVLEVRGQFSYLGPDGITYLIRYIANENGFQPEGDHLPKQQ